MRHCLRKSKVLQYFCNVRQNSTATDTFAEVMKVTNHTGLWDADLTWYSPSATPGFTAVVKMTNHTELWDAGIAWYSPWVTPGFAEVVKVTCVTSYMSDLPQWFRERPRNPRFYTYPILSDRLASCNPSEISWNICLWYCDQQCLDFLLNKWFCCLHSVRTLEA